MRNSTWDAGALMLALTLTLTACGAPEQEAAGDEAAAPRAQAAGVDTARLVAADNGAEPGQWMSVGRTYDEQRFSPLDQINTDNVSQLGLAWYADVETQRGQEATPLYIDGVLYTSTAWSHVYAFDARTGATLWHYDPEVPGQMGGRGCCDVVNRGVAAWNGKIYVAAYDGRLIALDAATGEEVWVTDTLADVGDEWPYSITGAPRVVKGRVIIGNAGAEFGVRGFVSAYDAETGELDWRWYTVPGNPADGFENDAMRMAAETWNGEWWRLGGGGTVWDAIIHDPELNLVYLGVGNGSPWNAELRSPGGGDNLFLSSIVALDADTGEYVWHYQETPGETWDYTATQPMMLADLVIAGEERRVLMQAPKNGFFYVLDAATGELISGTPYAPQTWTTGEIDESGRPVFIEEAFFGRTGRPYVVAPSAQGAHAWHPWSYSPDTGLVYLPYVATAGVMAPATAYDPVVGRANTGTGPASPDVWDTQPGARDLPRDGARLIAWDPVERREVWRTEPKGGVGSGALATAGGLVFHGSANLDGYLAAYDAATGEELWRANTRAGVVAAPMSYELDGEQYVAQLVGYGVPGYGNANGSRLLVYALGGTAGTPPAPPEPAPLVLDPPEQFAGGDTIAHGEELFIANCGMCHESSFANRGLFPNLRYSARLNSQEAFDAVVLHDALAENGMVGFDDVLDPPDTVAVRAYIVDLAHRLREQQQAQQAGAQGGPR